MNILLRCPLCHEALTKDAHSFVCAQRHCFDLAREGYVNLLPVQHKRSREPGDSPDMLLSRRTFLEAGYYDGFVGALASALGALNGKRVVDIGCGEGFYARQLCAGAQLVAIDIAKAGVRMAAKKARSSALSVDAEFAVASAAALPLHDDSMDMALSIFSPLHLDEAARVLKTGGRLCIAGAAPKHLRELSEAVYGEVREHAGHGLSADTHAAFELISHRHHREDIVLPHPLPGNLLKMTPYYWQAKPEAQQRIEALDQFSVTLDFDIQLLEKRP